MKVKDLFEGDILSFPKKKMQTYAVTVGNAMTGRKLLETAEGILREDGDVIIQGIQCAPQDILWVDPDTKKLSKDPSEKLLELTHSQAGHTIQAYTDVSNSINRGVKSLIPKGKDLNVIKMYNLHKDRYPNMSEDAMAYDLKLHQKIDSLAPHHDPEAIKQYVMNKHFNFYQFKVVGASPENDHPNEDELLALKAFSDRGGSLPQKIFRMISALLDSQA